MNEMLANISVTCFASSYLVAWVLEFSRLSFRSGIRGALMVGFAVAGLLAHTLFLITRAAQGSMPLSSSFDWYLLTAWVLVAVYLYLTYYFPRALLGLLVLPLALTMVVSAALWANRQPVSSVSATRLWGAIHGTVLLAGAVAVMIGFVAGVLYLFQAYRLKHHMPALGAFRFPPLEWLEKVNSNVIPFSTLMMTFGFISGVVLKTIQDQQFAALPWTDPVIWSSGLLLLWMLVAMVFNMVYRPARRGQKVAYLTVVSFVFLMFSLAMLLYSSTEHGIQRSREERVPSLGHATCLPTLGSPCLDGTSRHYLSMVLCGRGGVA